MLVIIQVGSESSLPDNIGVEMSKTMLLIILTFSTGILCAITHTVNLDGSAQFTAIQSAINASVDNDTVLVYPGRYLENITILNKRIILGSRELTTGNPLYIGQTIIDGQRLESCIKVSGTGQNESVFSIIRGFTITKGHAVIVQFQYFTEGGGVKIYNSAKVELINNRIFDNQSGVGGGVYISSGSLNLRGNSISGNIASVYGGGIYIVDGSIVNFDPIIRSSIYTNFAGQGSDILFFNFDNPPTVYADTISVIDQTSYFICNEQGWDWASPQPVIVANHAYINEINHDLYVSLNGNDDNDGQNPTSPLKTIAIAFQRIASDSLNPKTVFIAPGEYKQSEGQIYPIQLKTYINFMGSGENTTKIILDDPNFPTSGIMCRITKHAKFQGFSINGSDIQGTSGIYLRPEDPLAEILIDRLTFEHLKSLYPYTYGSSLFINACHNVTITNSNFQNNRANGSAGINLNRSSGLIENCNFKDNIADDLSQSMTEGCDIQAEVNGHLLIRNCNFSGGQTAFVNEPNSPLFGIVSIISEPGSISYVNIENCLFTDGHVAGGAAFTFSGENPGKMNIINCTFANNTSLETATVLNGYINVKNCIFKNPTTREIMLGYPQVYGVATNLHIDYSDVRGGAALIPLPQYYTWGMGNTTLDPLFASTNPLDDNYLYLTADSPCVDTGTPDTTGLFLPLADLAGNYRIWNNRVDMGCYEFGSPTGNEDDLPAKSGAAMYNYPNPFNPSTTISFHIPISSHVSLSVYNIRGQKVAQLINENMPLGLHKVVWDGKDNNKQAVGSGVYFVKLETGNETSTRKMILIK